MNYATNKTEHAFNKVNQERIRQNDKWGKQLHSNETWNWIFLEEYGEIAKAVLEDNPYEIQKELIQTLAVGIAWLEDMLERGVYRQEVNGGNNKSILEKRKNE